MDNFRVKKNTKKINVLKMTNNTTKKQNKKQFSDDKNNWITNDFER